MKLHIGGGDYDWPHLVGTYRHYARSESVVLEIGASVPHRTEELARYARKVIGIEYFKDRLPLSHDNIEYRLGDWQQLTDVVPENSIDIAVSSHCIEHIPDDTRAIQQLHRALKPRGVAILNTPNRRRLVRRLIEVFTGPRTFPHWEHVREYDWDDLHRLLERSPFTQFKVTPLVLGIHSGHVKFYYEEPPASLGNFANYWEILLIK